MDYIPITPEIALSFGWYIDYDRTSHKFKDGKETEFTTRSVCMHRSDFYMPLYFYYDYEQDSIEIRVTFSFKGGVEIFGFTKYSSNERLIKTTGDLKSCLNFMKMINSYEDKLKNYWDENLSELKDPHEKYYTR